MELDLSDVLGGGAQDQSLNTDLAATTPAGDSVFSAPFGAATAFRTPNGKAVRVAFVFDPQAAYDETAIVASIEKDYMAAVREGLTRALLKPEEIAQRVSTEEEAVLATIRKSLPAEVLSELYFAEKENLDKYVAMIDRRAREAYREEITLGERLKTENFRFAFKIAIDAFLNKNADPKSNRRKGVLTIRIDGGDYAVASLALTASKPDESAVAAERSPKPARKGGDPASQAILIAKADRKEVEELTEALQLHKIEGMIEKTEKNFPDSTDDFFNAISSWFGTVVATRARKLEETSAQKMPLYN